jgi:hypothetical protein
MGSKVDIQHGKENGKVPPKLTGYDGQPRNDGQRRLVSNILVLWARARNFQDLKAQGHEPSSLVRHLG